ncbi:MAG: class I SAM-dependent methyltransferase, partial [Planctomycetota bacterium]
MMVRARTTAAAAACLVAAMLSADTEAGAASAREILDKSGVRGGLVVHLGCGTGELTAQLRAGPAYLVHGLDTDPAKVAAARRRIAGLGLYGPVSVDIYDGKRPPYV